MATWRKASPKRQLPFWSGQLPFSFFCSYKNRVGRDPGGPRLRRHPSRCKSQWRMVPLFPSETAYKGPHGLYVGSAQFWAEIRPFWAEMGNNAIGTALLEPHLLLDRDGENKRKRHRLALTSVGPRWGKSLDELLNFVPFRVDSFNLFKKIISYSKFLFVNVVMFLCAKPNKILKKTYVVCVYLSIKIFVAYWVFFLKLAYSRHRTGSCGKMWISKMNKH